MGFSTSMTKPKTRFPPAQHEPKYDMENTWERTRPSQPAVPPEAPTVRCLVDQAGLTPVDAGRGGLKRQKWRDGRSNASVCRRRDGQESVTLSRTQDQR